MKNLPSPNFVDKRRGPLLAGAEMNKAELIEKVARDVKMSKMDTEKILTSLTTIVTRALRKGDRISLTGFGTFIVSERGPRTGRNPRTGETIAIEASRVPHFRPGKEFKSLLK